MEKVKKKGRRGRKGVGGGGRGGGGTGGAGGAEEETTNLAWALVVIICDSIQNPPTNKRYLVVDTGPFCLP